MSIFTHVHFSICAHNSTEPLSKVHALAPCPPTSPSQHVNYKLSLKHADVSRISFSYWTDNVTINYLFSNRNLIVKMAGYLYMTKTNT